MDNLINAKQISSHNYTLNNEIKNDANVTLRLSTNKFGTDLQVNKLFNNNFAK